MRILEKTFQELSVEELYALLKLRVDVFMIEQACFYDELDNQDQTAHHLLAIQDDSLIGYARILFEKSHLHIGRIVVHPSHRKKGIAHQLIMQSMAFCKKNYPKEDIYLSAQAHLEGYYQSYGYKTISKPYDWDGISHVDMKYSKKKTEQIDE